MKTQRNKLVVTIQDVCPICDGSGKVEACVEGIFVSCAICNGIGYRSKSSFTVMPEANDHEIYCKFIIELKELS